MASTGLFIDKYVNCVRQNQSETHATLNLPHNLSNSIRKRTHIRHFQRLLLFTLEFADIKIPLTVLLCNAWQLINRFRKVYVQWGKYNITGKTT